MCNVVNLTTIRGPLHSKGKIQRIHCGETKERLGLSMNDLLLQVLKYLTYMTVSQNPFCVKSSFTRGNSP